MYDPALIEDSKAAYVRLLALVVIVQGQAVHWHAQKVHGSSPEWEISPSRPCHLSRAHVGHGVAAGLGAPVDGGGEPKGQAGVWGVQ